MDAQLDMLRTKNVKGHCDNSLDQGCLPLDIIGGNFSIVAFSWPKGELFE